MVLSNTTAAHTVTFADDLMTPTLTTTGNNYNLELLGVNTRVTGTVNPTVFMNTGTLKLGDASADTLNFAGGLTATAPSAISMAGTVGTADAAITLGTAPVTLLANTTINAGTGAISFGGTVDGAYSLVLNSTGITTLSNKVGFGAALTSLTTNTDGTLMLNAGSVSTTGAQSYGEAITLVRATTVNAGAGNVTFSSTVDGAYDLTVNTTGTTRLDGVVGGVDALSSLRTVAGGTVALNDGRITSTGAQSYGGAVTLGADTILSAGAGSVSFRGTVDGSHALTVNSTGITSFEDAVGGATPLSSLTTNLGGMVLVNTDTVHTTGSQTFNDMLTLLQSATLTGSSVTFNAAVMSAGDLSVVGATTLNGSSVATTGAQSYSGAVTLQKDALIDAGVGSVTFNGTVDTASGISAKSLTVNTSGVTTFGAAVGGTHALSSLSTDANTGGSVVLNGSSVTTTGAQTYGEAVSLGVDTTLTSRSAGSIRFANTLNGGYALTVNTNGATTFDDVVGSITPLTRLTTDAGGTVVVNGGAVTTSGAQTYNDAMTLGANTTLTSTGGTLSFVSITDGASVFDLSLRNATSLALADVDIGGNLHVTTQVGGVSQLAGSSLNVGGTATFTADTGTHQVAALSSTGNTFTGLLTLDQVNSGSWADVSVTTDAPLALAPLQSAGSVNLQAQGTVTTSSITASGSMVVNSNGGAVSVGVTTVSGDLTLQSGNGSVTQTGQFVVTGDTSVAAGTGTITLDNVLNSFGSTLALQGQSTTVATSGNLQLASVTNSGPMSLRAPNGSIDLGTAFITGGDLTLQSRDDMNLGGANITGSLNMSSTEGTVSFGQATVTGNLTAATLGQQVDLGSASVGGNLSVQTHGGSIVQSTAPNSALQVTGTSTLNAGTGNVTLPNVPNQFGGAVSLQANNVELVGSHGLILGNSTVTGTLEVTAATGNITQSAPLSVTGGSTFTATQGDVVLERANTFVQPVVVDAVNATLSSTSALTLGASTVTGDLIANVAQGDLTQTGPLTVGGKANVTTLAGNVTLTDAANSFAATVSAATTGTLKLTSGGPLTLGLVTTVGDTDLKSLGKLDLGTSTFGAKINANSGGFDIIQSGPIKVGGNSNFDAGNAKIDLFNAKNAWSGSILYKGGIVMINHPQLMNAVSAGTLVVRVETAMQEGQTQKAVPAQAANTLVQTPASSGGADVSVSVTRVATTTQSGMVTVSVSADAASTSKGFAFALTDHMPADVPKSSQIAVSQLDGRPLPDWLRYEPETQKVVATSPPPGAFPMQIKANMGGVETVILITEQPK